MGTDWFYTLVFIFTILTTLKLGVQIIMNFTSDNPTKLNLTSKELIFYGVSFSYFLNYLIT